MTSLRIQFGYIWMNYVVTTRRNLTGNWRLGQGNHSQMASNGRILQFGESFQCPNDTGHILGTSWGYQRGLFLHKQQYNMILDIIYIYIYVDNI